MWRQMATLDNQSLMNFINDDDTNRYTYRPRKVVVFDYV